MSYNEAREKYAKLGVETDAAIARLKSVPVSLHCWQGDDVRGFDTDPSKPLTGGIQTTGNYPGRARTPEELMSDIDMVLKLCPGAKKLNLHASYAIFEDGEWVDRDKLEPKHFKKWVDFCKAHGIGADFNPTFFSHPMCDPLTLSSPNEETRRFWIEHGKACVRISQYLADELGQPCTMNIWTGDGFKDVPADRLGPRVRYRESMDEILSEPYDFSKVKPCIESKVFGIGVESYTVGSAEFALSYAAMNRDKCIPLMDNGHYHPTEVVSDKIPALLAFFPEIALHVTRPVRWDSDHVVLFDDETKEICKEIVRCGGLDGRVNIALDYFDASINRIAAWTVGFRNLQKALLYALVTPDMKDLQDGDVRRNRMYGRDIVASEMWRPDCRFFSDTKLPQDLPDMAVSVLVDQSGSMYGQRMGAAMKATMLLHDFAERVHVPVAVYGHNVTMHGRVNLFVYTDFLKAGKRDKYRLAKLSTGGCNRDGAALEVVANLLNARPERTKLLIIISDGKPNDDSYGGDSAAKDIKDIVARNRRRGVEIVAAAIGDDKEYLKKIYGDQFLDITDLSTFPKAMVKIVKKRLKV